MQWLAKIAEQHDEWLKIAKIFAPDHEAEDAVQQAYLELHKYADPERIFKDGKLDRGYVFLTIRNICYRNEKKRVRCADEMPYDLTDNTDLSDEYAWESFCKKVDDEVKSWEGSKGWADRVLFNEYRFNDTSFRKMAHKYNVTWVTLYRDMARCKVKLKEQLGEDYTDYLNGDYEYL